MNKPLLLLALGLLFSNVLPAQVSLIPFGAAWKYLDDGSDQGTAWRYMSYDDNVWKSGATEIGYGEGDEATVISNGGSDNDRYITTYLRTIVTISDASAFSSYTGQIIRDDGAVVYVNGKEVYRTNLPEGDITFTTPALRGADNDDGRKVHEFTIEASSFISGTNIIAVEVHQVSSKDKDMSFNFALSATKAPDQTPPSVVSISRQDPTTEITNATQVTFRAIFSEAVSGVDASDFTATVVSGNLTSNVATVTATDPSNTTYDVVVGSLSGSGVLRLDLNASGTGIADTAGNAISGGYTSGETYSINIDETAPTVVSIDRYTPTTETTDATSVTYKVTFSEGVTGVDAADFTATVVSGSLSASVTTLAMDGTDGSTYLVTVGSITGDGILRLDLKASGTGITDAAGNNLTGGFTTGQTYTIQQTTVASQLTRGPYLQMVSGTAVTIRWRTDVATDSKAEAGTTLGNYTAAGSDNTSTTEHEVRITGLVPGTRYYYRFGSSTQVLQEGTDNYFYTAPPAATTQKIRVAAFGDCGVSGTVQRNVLNAYRNYTGANPAELMLLLGDNAYEDGTDAEYQTNFFTPYGSTVLKNHALFPTPGNHDYHTTSLTSRSAPYYKNFTMPTAGECGGVASGTEAYYSYNWGNIHFISLDSYGVESADNTKLYDTLGPQVTWVKKDLAANTSQWTVVYWHHPPFTKGTHNSDTETELINIRQNFIRILERYGVDLVLCGHSHDYERSYLLKGYYGTEDSFNPDLHTASLSSGKYNGTTNSCPYTTEPGKVNHGTVYVVAGSAARSGATVSSDFPHAALPFATTDGGMFYFEVEDNRLDAKLIREDGTIFDQFTILKGVNKTSDLSVNLADPLTLTASWIGNYIWSNGATTRSITVTPSTDINYTVTDDHNCLQDVFNISVLNTSARAGIAPSATEDQSSGVQVFPTVVKKGGTLSVRPHTSEAVEAMVIDNNGRLIRTQWITGNTSLQTSNLSSGIYFLVLKNKDKVSKHRFVVTE